MLGSRAVSDPGWPLMSVRGHMLSNTNREENTKHSVCVCIIWPWPTFMGIADMNIFRVKTEQNMVSAVQSVDGAVQSICGICVLFV